MAKQIVIEKEDGTKRVIRTIDEMFDWLQEWREGLEEQTADFEEEDAHWAEGWVDCVDSLIGKICEDSTSDSVQL